MDVVRRSGSSSGWSEWSERGRLGQPPRLALVFGTVAAVAALGLGATGCGSEAPEPGANVAPPVDPAPVVEVAAAPVQVLDADGNLLASDEALGGLVLPRGLQPLDGNTENRRTYSIPVPPRVVARYFGPRLMTGEVARIGDGAVFRNATPQHPEGQAFRMNVQVLAQAPGRTLVRIHLLGIPGVATTRMAPSEAELREFDRYQD